MDKDTLVISFPRQMLSFKSKTKAWRKQCVNFGDSKTYFNYSPVRNNVRRKKIAYDLLNGKLHMDDLKMVINPSNIVSKVEEEEIQHYPIINSKVEVLKGEALRRPFDYRVVVTNPTALSEIENNKKKAIHQAIQDWVSNTSQSEEEASQELDRIGDYFSYEWQDFREIRANRLLKHYSTELNFPNIFGEGFSDAYTVAEEIYQCDIVGGEPTLEKVNPLKIRILRSGTSNRVEDADMIILEDYWSPGRVIDYFYDSLTKKDIEYIENIPFNHQGGFEDSMGNYDEAKSFVHTNMVSDVFEQDTYTDLFGDGSVSTGLLPYDLAGNVKVLRVYWKSKRKIKKVKSYNQETGEEEYTFYPENYIVRPELGEEETIYWINEAWEGTKIGDNIYVQMRPKVVQYNSISNPSKCHFGIVGSIYNFNDNKPFSLVDRMKPYNYLYDVLHHRLNKLLARNYGNIMRVDVSKIPEGWTMDKWLYYAQMMGIAVENSFNEGKKGAATGKIAGALNNNTSGVIPTSDGNLIQQYVNMMEWIKNEMSEVAGISKQREGQIANRETVGGVERATLQSSYITEYLFNTHDDVKRRAVQCFIDTAKVAIKGKSKKFEYILDDGSRRVMEIDGDEFNECDYGIVLDNTNASQELNQNITTLAQAALQNQAISFSTMIKLFSTTSLAEKIRMIERNEQKLEQQKQQELQQQQQLQQQQIESNAQAAQQQMEMQYKMHTEDNETKILVAQINGKAEADRLAIINRDQGAMTEGEKAKLQESLRQFDEKIKLENKKLEQENKHHAEDNALKLKLSKNKS